MIATALFITVLLASDRPALTGVIYDADEKPLEGATVSIETARPKTGPALYCPSCYADCAKSSPTAADGSFRIVDLDPKLTFNVLALCPGYAPTLIEKVDPQTGPVKAKLAHIDPARLAADKSVRGRVIDKDGKPIAQALVESFLIGNKDGSGGSPTKDVDSLAVTDKRGEFVITFDSTVETVSVRVRARGYAMHPMVDLTVGKPQQDITIVRGATVFGRITRDGKPLPGVSVGLCQQLHFRRLETAVNWEDVLANSDGVFTFVNVTPDCDYYVYGKMESFAPFGTTPLVTAKVGSDGEAIGLGDIEIEPGNRVRARIQLADAKPMPPDARVMISRDQIEDTIELTPQPDGTFALDNVPSEPFELIFHIPGYVLSPKNVSRQPGQRQVLRGLITRDLDDLVVLFEPGEPPKETHFDGALLADLDRKLITGIPK